MPSPVYDDEKTESAAPGQHDNLGVSAEDKRQEIAGLEDDFARPSAKTDDKKNSAGGVGPKSKDDGSASPSLYNPSAGGGAGAGAAQAISGYRPTKKQGGILTSFIAIFIAVVVGINSLGPLQFIHFAQMLQAFHFSDQEYEGNSRIKKLLIYAKTGDAKSTRIGVIANRQAKKIDAKFNANGWEIKSKATVFTGFEYDPNRKEGTPQEKKARPTLEEMKAKLEAGGVKGATIKNGKLVVPPEGVKYWSNKTLIKTMYTGSGNRDVGRITAAFEKRILIKRAGISFNPITKLKSKGTVALAEWKEKRSEKLKGKAPPEITAGVAEPGANATEEEKKAAAAGEEAAAESNNLADEAKEGKLSSGKFSNGLKAGGGVAAGVGFLCIVKTVADGASEASKANRLVPLVQLGADVVSMGSKAQDGKDTSMEVYSEVSKTLHSKTNGDFTSASTIRHEQGLTGGKTLPPELDPNGGQNLVSEMLSKIPYFDGICSILNNTVVSIVSGLLTPFSSLAIAGFFASPQGQLLFEKLIGFFTTDVIDLSDPKYAGGITGEAANLGTLIMANETAASMGGRPLNANEERAQKQVVLQEKQRDNATKSIASKYLDPYNYDTPIAKAIDGVQTNSITATVAHLPQVFLASITAPFVKNAMAADSVTTEQAYYGFKKVGFAPGTLDTVENPYTNAEQVKKIIKSNGDKYINLLKECNKVEVIGLGDTEELNFTTETGSGEEPAIMGTYDKAPAECSQDDPEFLKVRAAVYDTMTFNSFACVEFDDVAGCESIGLGKAPENQISVSTAGIDGWVWPVKKETLDNPSGSGLNQCWLHYHVKGDGSAGYHAAIDIDVTYKPVYAANSGKVVKKAKDGYNTLVIQHANSFYSTYEHMSTITVSEGDEVVAGQVIGKSGEVGTVGAPHLHFGISLDANRFGTYADPWATVNPLDFLPNDYSPALLKDDGMSCKTADIKGRSDYGFATYKTLGSYAPYKN